MDATRALFRGVRPLDVAITAVLTFLGVLLMNMQVGMEVGKPVDGVTIDSNTGWLYLFLVAPLAALWWRRNVIAVVLVATAVMVLHTLLFGQVVRCGAGLPLVFVLSFFAGYQEDRSTAWCALAGAQVLGFSVLIRDAQVGVEILPVVSAMSAGVWWVARLARRRSTLGRELRVRNEELRALRDQRALLEVTGDRARVSGELDSLLDRRLRQLTTLAEAGARTADPAAAEALLTRIEDEGRRTLDEMRDVVGRLRGGEVALSPAPSVAHLDALLAQHGNQLVVTGDPRSLPASVELSAYRIVEHLLGVLDRDGEPPVDVRMDFEGGSLEVTVTGRVSRGADVRDAIARARERARLQDGSLHVKLTRGRARAVARLPVTI
ncbi:signal transduction histidine kinase [Marmoricola sp. URHA0025 HA25]